MGRKVTKKIVTSWLCAMQKDPKIHSRRWWSLSDFHAKFTEDNDGFDTKPSGFKKILNNIAMDSIFTALKINSTPVNYGQCPWRSFVTFLPIIKRNF